MAKKSEGKKLAEELLSKRKNGILRVEEETVSECDGYCEDYKKFLDECKTEREAVKYAEAAAKKKGYKPFKAGQKLKAGDKVYRVNRGKAILLAHIGKKGVKEGVRLAAAHIDSPRLDLKQHPLYESEEAAYFKTHYYGGIKKYQWGTIPLALQRCGAFRAII